MSRASEAGQNFLAASESTLGASVFKKPWAFGSTAMTLTAVGDLRSATGP